MVNRLSARVVRRPSVPLTDEDERELGFLRSVPECRSALAELSGEDVAAGEPSEAAFLHALLIAGQKAVRSAIEEAGYAATAAEQVAAATTRKTEARRRRPSWADEE